MMVNVTFENAKDALSLKDIKETDSPFDTGAFLDRYNVLFIPAADFVRDFWLQVDGSTFEAFSTENLCAEEPLRSVEVEIEIKVK